ncbi:MAG: hypothetical protein NTX91_02995 [candidate division SR1 bacterium]|nr:hypothetical protein [candidate division SR1 bacterium]
MGKKVILVRHGKYNEDEEANLSNEGIGDMKRLALILFPYIVDKNVIFIASMANRGIQSAEVLQEIWEKNNVFLPFEKKYEVWSGTDSRRESSRLLEKEKKTVSVHDFNWLSSFIKEDKHEVIVVVTHLEFVEYFPSRLGFEGQEISKGRAMILDMENMTRSIV